MFEFKKLLPLLVIFVIVIAILFVFDKSDVKEDFRVWNWNYPTRYYPSYDLRGYPYVYTFPWNWPYPFPYWSPYYYSAGGRYLYNPRLRRTRSR